MGRGRAITLFFIFLLIRFFSSKDKAEAIRKSWKEAQCCIKACKILFLMIIAQYYVQEENMDVHGIRGSQDQGHADFFLVNNCISFFFFATLNIL